jgi:putative effector of murein hydrolase LrgA (UPF0299 family)
MKNIDMNIAPALSVLLMLVSISIYMAPHFGRPATGAVYGLLLITLYLVNPRDLFKHEETNKDKMVII